MMTREIAVVLAAATLLLVPGCGDDQPSDGSGAANADTSVSIDSDVTSGSGSVEEVEETTAPPIEKDAGDPASALQELFQAYYDGDGDLACGRQTERYTKEAIEEAIKDEYVENGATCADLVAAASALYQAFGIDIAGSTYEVVTDDGDSATVAFSTPGEESSESYVLVNTDGQWLLDEEIQTD